MYGSELATERACQAFAWVRYHALAHSPGCACARGSRQRFEPPLPLSQWWEILQVTHQVTEAVASLVGPPRHVAAADSGVVHQE